VTVEDFAITPAWGCLRKRAHLALWA
jgi:hypothetical protein